MALIVPKTYYVGYFDSDISKPGITKTEKHLIYNYQIEFCVEDGGISYIDDGFCNIKNGTVICAKPGQYRNTLLPFKCYYIQLYQGDGEVYDLINKIPNSFTISNEKINVYVEKIKKMTLLYYEDSELSKLRLCANILELLASLAEESVGYETMKNDVFLHRKKHQIEPSLEYIENNFHTSCSLEKIAEQSNFSKIYFHNLFKRITGVTTHEYLLQRRINESIKLLATTPLSLTQISINCGFSSLSYFQTIFFKEKGIRPSDFRKKLQKKYLERIK